MHLIRINFGQITTTQTLLPLVEQLRQLCHTRITLLKVNIDFFKDVLQFNINKFFFKYLKDTVGFNLAAISFIRQKVEENDQIRLFSDLTIKHKEKNKKNKVTLVSLKSASSVS